MNLGVWHRPIRGRSIRTGILLIAPCPQTIIIIDDDPSHPSTALTTVNAVHDV